MDAGWSVGYLLSAKIFYPIEDRCEEGRRRELVMISINRVVEKEQQCDEHPVVIFNLKIQKVKDHSNLDMLMLQIHSLSRRSISIPNFPNYIHNLC